MYIRKTKIKSGKNGKPYFTYRLVESNRTENGVQQRTLLNLGRHFYVAQKDWLELAKRIEAIISGQVNLLAVDEQIETAAQRYAAWVIQKQKQQAGQSEQTQYHNVDVNTIEMIRPRSVGLEHVCLSALNQLKLPSKLKELGFNRHQIHGAIGTIIGRMCVPGSELATHNWLCKKTGLGELLGYDYEGMSLSRIYQISDLLLKHKQQIENHLYNRERQLFDFKDTITLYDLTNTYFEGSGKFNSLAGYGRSKEKRSDCPLVTLALVLDGSGFPKKSRVYSGNASEPSTLQEMIAGLADNSPDDKQQQLFEKAKPTIIMDAGIATEDNIKWVRKKGYKYLVVSRKQHRQFDQALSVEVKKDRDYTIEVQKVINEQSGEVELYCHSSRREEKDRAIQELYFTRFEDSLQKLQAGLSKKGCLKNYEKVIEKIGRIKQKYSRVSKHYKITVEKQDKGRNAANVTWQRQIIEDTPDWHPGVYCLRTNLDDWDESTLWRTYTMLTDLEAVFRSLKSELGLRPVFHQKTKRVSGHLFITLIAYHVVHTIRRQLKEEKIISSWSEIRKQLSGQYRATVTMQCESGETINVRKSSQPEPEQQKIYKALGVPMCPGRTFKKIIE